MAAVLKTKDFEDHLWRLSHLYWVLDETGKKFLFQPNDEQKELLACMWHLNVILKARQLGITTLIDLLILDQCVFMPNISAGIIAHNLDDAMKIFRNKIETPWKNLPEAVRKSNPLVKESGSEYVWANGSSVSVGTSMRSGTLQYLHVSEFGKIARKFPEKSREIRTGALNAVHAGQFVFIESTAEGRGGDFFEIVQIARKMRDSGKDLTPMDYRLHFFPWWRKPEYAMSPLGVEIPATFKKYFVDLRNDHGIKLGLTQMAWYVKKAAVMKEDMKREFPSFEDEAFEAANEDKFFGHQMAQLRKDGRIKIIPVLPDRPVHTFWDIGLDQTSILMMQYVALEYRFIDHIWNSGEELSWYLKEMQKKPYLWGTIYLPHDAEDNSLQAGATTVASRIRKALPGAKVKIVPRTKTKSAAIDAGRARLAECWIHSENCSHFVESMDNYHKSWNEVLGVWREEPVHDKWSHDADAYLQFVQGWSEADMNDNGFVIPKSMVISSFNPYSV
jgi:hypothetical protein